MLLVLGIACVAYTWNAEAVFFQGNTYFTDGDCYARMTRVRHLQEHPFQPIRNHDFENYPIGTRPHTTAPLDYLIAAFAGVLGRFSKDPLSLAGAWISPTLGLLTVGLLAVWRRREPYVAAMLLLLAVSPIIAHGFALGRPDHQSVLLLLLAVALAAEVDMWSGRERGRLSAMAWALALWVSLFEPLVLLGTVLVLRLACRQIRLARVPLGIFCGILLLGYLVDGWRVAAFDPHFGNWAKNIGELRHGSWQMLSCWAGWLGLVAPIGLLAAWLRKREPAGLLLSVLTGLLAGLSLWHLRWGYFFVLVFALSLPKLLAFLFRRKAVGWGIFVLSLWPVASSWEGTLFPDEATFRARTESVADAVALRDAAIRLQGLPVRGVIAPWWFSPEVVWWSGQPCVAGTSHQSLPGIVDASEFYLSEGTGREILDRRNVGYVLAYEPDRVISNAALILGRVPPSDPLARRLYLHPHQAGYPLLHANRFFKVFGVDQK
ncbi:MAG: hypothetical protein IAE94_02395 [Chthoniobacterales bacterium]|nr:hypothetical protein [Chthoniobacterales bacterium]